MSTRIQSLNIVVYAVVVGAMTMAGQVVKCTFAQGSGYPGDATKCMDVGDCGPQGTSCCLKYTCPGHPPACNQNLGQACTFTFTCSDIDTSTACDSDCGLDRDASSRRGPVHRAGKSAAAMTLASFQVPQPVTPFTLVREVVSFQHSVEGELHRSQTIAVRGDGSRSVTETILGKAGISRSELKRTIHFADGKRVTQFLALGVKNTWPTLDEATVAERMARSQAVEAANCVIPGWAVIGADTIQQQPVAILSDSFGDPAWKLTVWEAPQLGCEDLRQRSYNKQAEGSFALRTETRTVSLRVGEPDTSLFEEPAGLREASPMEVGQLLARKYALPLSPEQIRELVGPFETSYSGSGGRRH